MAGLFAKTMTCTLGCFDVTDRSMAYQYVRRLHFTTQKVIHYTFPGYYTTQKVLPHFQFKVCIAFLVGNGLYVSQLAPQQSNAVRRTRWGIYHTYSSTYNRAGWSWNTLALFYLSYINLPFLRTICEFGLVGQCLAELCTNKYVVVVPVLACAIL